MEKEFNPAAGIGVAETLESIGVEIPADVPFAPAVPEPAGFPWGGVGIGVLVVAVAAIAVKVLSD
jgi:hypothetical protein|tara:strand:- start:354 stop:548 length:195 start_codon:yes stop_codon:yes gene_type:complete